MINEQNQKTLNNLNSLNTTNGQTSELEKQKLFNDLKATTEAFLNDDSNIFQEDEDDEFAFKKHIFLKQMNKIDWMNQKNYLIKIHYKDIFSAI